MIDFSNNKAEKKYYVVFFTSGGSSSFDQDSTFGSLSKLQ